MSRRNERVEQGLRDTAAEFVESISDRSTLITVTRASLSPDLARATIFVTVLPEAKEQVALAFLKRHERDLRGYLKEHAVFKRLPHTSFSLDEGEKMRHKIDTLS